jgi:hypothetical protein
MQARIWMLDYKTKYYMKETSNKALDPLVLAEIPLSYNTMNKYSLKFLRTCPSWALHWEWRMAYASRLSGKNMTLNL